MTSAEEDQALAQALQADQAELNVFDADTQPGTVNNPPPTSSST